MAGTGFSPAALSIGANAIRSAIKGVQAHTADPGVGGAANKSSAAMAVPAWSVVNANGGWGLAQPIALTGGTPNGPVQYVSLWTTADATGIWLGNYKLSGDLTFDSNGAYTIESLDFTGSAA